MPLALQFDQMREREVKPNVYIYNALIKAQASTGDLVEVVLLVSRPADHSSANIWIAIGQKFPLEEQHVSIEFV